MLITDNARTVLEKRYFKRNEQGNVVEDWSGMITRVAKNIAGDDQSLERKFFELLDSGAFLPNSPTLMNAGNDLQQLSACFVLPIEDSMESIFTSIKNAALIHKSGGGTGFSFSRLREANSRVKTTSGVSSGPLSFMKVFNQATDAVKQGGTRRGANMAILSVTHPNILDFITAKEKTTELCNFNLSVGITQKFMESVMNDELYELISPYSRKTVQKLKARDVFSLIIEMAHKSGEPGIIFLDRINEFNPTPHIGELESTNPCGEQPLLAYEACNLGSINLTIFYQKGKFDWEYLKKVVYDSVEFLDCVIDKSKFPLLEIEQMVLKNRKIGLGLMGWAELLFAMQIPYNSEQAINFAEEIMEFIDYHGKEKSMQIAILKGSFPNFPGSIYEKGTLQRETKNKDWKSLIKKIQKNGIRNATVSTIAPTGTISMICNTSGGIEPHFSLVYIKQVLDGEKLLYINDTFAKILVDQGLYSKELMEKIAEEGGVAHLPDVPKSIQKIFVTSHDISPEWHIRMQAAFQKYTDNAVSKTINFAKEATKEEIQIAFERAWELGCKGITVYRDGSRESQVLHLGNKTNDEKKEPDEGRISPRIRPTVTQGITQKVSTGCGNLYVTINRDDRGPCEVFVQMGKVGGCPSAQLEAIARLVSMSLRANITLEAIIAQLGGIRCPHPMWNHGTVISSCADAISVALATFLECQKQGLINGKIDISGVKRVFNNTQKSHQLCPDCGCMIEHSQGCMNCSNCGWSKC